MRIIDVFLAELDREEERSKRALEQVMEGQYDWKPHERSMGFGYLCEIVARIPGWVAFVVNKDELDLNPPGGGVHGGSRCARAPTCFGGWRRALAMRRRRCGERQTII